MVSFCLVGTIRQALTRMGLPQDVSESHTLSLFAGADFLVLPSSLRKERMFYKESACCR